MGNSAEVCNTFITQGVGSLPSVSFKIFAVRPTIFCSPPDVYSTINSKQITTEGTGSESTQGVLNTGVSNYVSNSTHKKMKIHVFINILVE